MAKPKVKGAAPAKPAPKEEPFRAPTEGLEHVIFNYGAKMKPGEFQDHLEALAEHLARSMKKCGPMAARAIKKSEEPAFNYPDEPNPKDGESMSKKQELEFE